MQSSDSRSQTTSLNVKRYKPFWDEFTQKLTNWFDSIKPTHTDLNNISLLPDGTWNNFKDAISSKENLTSPSSFDAISLSSASSSKKSPAGKTHKIRPYPNLEEKNKLLKWIDKKYLHENYITNKPEKFKDIINLSSDLKRINHNASPLYQGTGDETVVIIHFSKVLKQAKKIPEINHELRLTMDRLGPKFSVVDENKGAGIISLDPGARTLMTGYNPSGEVLEWGKGDISRIHRLCLHYDRIQGERDSSIHDKTNKRKRDVNGARNILLKYITEKQQESFTMLGLTPETPYCRLSM
ncbi:9937_t:CDS:2 [Entrophospora sp. SA101]|nr:9937_t:CDS:2 [Entrophospora sp. SA101]